MSNDSPEYDALANIYDLWASADPACKATHDFYVRLCSESKGIIVELGIGTGRIAIDIAKMGKNIIGVDISNSMLEKCRLRAMKEGVLDRIRLIQSDIRAFELHQKANLIIFPFRSIGHFLSIRSKKQALQNIYNQLVPGGQLVFDHYIFCESWAKNHDGIPRLMYHSQLPNDGNLYLWDTYQYDYSAQQMACTITIEKTDKNGIVGSRVHCPLSFSWIDPKQIRQIATDVGLEFEAVYGDFSYNELTNASSEQVWLFRRPRN